MSETTASTAQHPIQDYTDRADRFTAVLAAAEGSWDSSTPCEGWTVADIVAHVVQTQRDFLTTQGLDLGPAPDLGDPGVAWQLHDGRVRAVLADGGVARREYDGFFGRTTIGATMVDFYGWDLAVHGWDVARAVGQEWTISEDEATVLHATADGWGEALYSEGICQGPVQVPADAPATDRLVARLGRDPHWRPA